MNKSKNLGTAFETAVANYLIASDIPTRRAILAGGKDVGDLHTDDGEWVIQCKNVARIDLAGACDAIHAQVMNEETARTKRNRSPNIVYPRGVAVIKRRGKGVYAAYAVMPFIEFIEIMKDRSKK